MACTVSKNEFWPKHTLEKRHGESRRVDIRLGLHFLWKVNQSVKVCKYYGTDTCANEVLDALLVWGNYILYHYSSDGEGNVFFGKWIGLKLMAVNG